MRSFEQQLQMLVSRIRDIQSQFGDDEAARTFSLIDEIYFTMCCLIENGAYHEVQLTSSFFRNITKNLPSQRCIQELFYVQARVYTLLCIF